MSVGLCWGQQHPQGCPQRFTDPEIHPPQVLAVGNRHTTAGSSSSTRRLPCSTGVNPLSLSQSLAPGVWVTCGWRCPHIPRRQGTPARIPHHPAKGTAALLPLHGLIAHRSQQSTHGCSHLGHPQLPALYTMAGEGEHLPSPGTCVSNVAGSSRESPRSESSTKFLSDRVMGPSSLRGARQGEGTLGPSRTELEWGNPRRARPRHPPAPG